MTSSNEHIPKCHTSVKKSHDVIEKSEYYHVIIDVSDKGPNLTKEQCLELSKNINKFLRNDIE
jgi:hypothetical protein